MILIYFRFVLANVYLTINISFQAYGNSTMDCMISTFFCTTKTQLQMLKYNLENIVNLDDNSEATEYSPYLDSDLIQRRLRLCVQHHLQILWWDL
uniref:Odorant receptor n=1 Tax=Leucinodes orbonalis TaxID=711050 RepID=A0AAU0QL73_9NEOP|nr:odorant receptor [Leucinodes orbonalis]